MKDKETALRTTWDRQTVGQHFGQDAAIFEPSQHGHEGYRLFIPPTGEPHAAVTIFPDAAHFRVQTRNGDFHIRHATPPRLTTGGMQIESADGTTQVLVTHAGAVAIQSFPSSFGPLESPTGIPDAQTAVSATNEEKTRPIASGDEIRPSQEVSAIPSPAEGRERQQRKKWTGYISADPAFSTGSDGVPRANFVVSERVEVEGEEKTIYHRVYSTKKEAQRLQDKNLSKGTHVTVDGYVQLRDVRKPDGKTVKEPRVYANHVTFLPRGDRAQEQAGDSEPAGERQEDADSDTVTRVT